MVCNQLNKATRLVTVWPKNEGATAIHLPNKEELQGIEGHPELTDDIHH